MPIRTILALAAIPGFSSCVWAQTAPPVTRTVTGQVLTSKEMPAVQLKFDPAFKYIGNQSFATDRMREHITKNA